MLEAEHGPRGAHERFFVDLKRAAEPGPIHAKIARERVRGALFGVEAAPRIGRYVVRGPLGAGGHGCVFAATDPILGREVALKVLHPAVSGAATATMERECRTIARIQHPHVVAVHDAGPIPGDARWFIAMERVDGTPLGTWCEGERPGWVRVAKALAGVAEALAAAHEAGVVHRDVKPGNVLVLADNDHAKIVDFGIARGLGESAASDARLEFLGADPEQTIGMVGTEGYMAPECARGEAASPAADVFALGVTLHEALYGERPGLARLDAKDRRGRRVPRAVRRLLGRCLHDTATRRPTATEVAEVLRAAANRHRYARASLILGAAVVLAAGVAGHLGQERSHRRAVLHMLQQAAALAEAGEWRQAELAYQAVSQVAREAGRLDEAREADLQAIWTGAHVHGWASRALERALIKLRSNAVAEDRGRWVETAVRLACGVGDTAVVQEFSGELGRPDAPASPDYLARLSALAPVAHWRFDEAAGARPGTVVLDASGTHHGRYIGDAYGRVEGPLPEGGTALALGGQGWVEIPDHSELRTTSPITVALWVRRDGQGPMWSHAVTKGPAQWRDYGLSSEPNGLGSWVAAGRRPDGRASVRLRSRPPVELGEWAHLAASFDGDEVRFYLNGELQGVGTRTGGFPRVHGPLRFGHDGAVQEFFMGRIAEPAVFGRALTAHEVRWLRRGGMPSGPRELCDQIERHEAPALIP